jgi:hypothetical protein
VSFTAFIITCLARAIEMNKAVHAFLDWRSRLVIYDDVNVNVMVEVDSEQGKIVVPRSQGGVLTTMCPWAFTILFVITNASTTLKVYKQHLDPDNRRLGVDCFLARALLYLPLVSCSGVVTREQ